MRVFNFAAGPATLPLEVLQQAQAEMTDWKGSGMSVMEVSHRSKAFIAVAQEAEADLRELLAIPANYKVLFLQGGATGMFSAIPMNLATADSTVDYVNTGAWSKKAIGEAKRYAKVNVSADEAATNYSSVPAQGALKLSPNAAYFHYTPNETIGGVEFDYVPQVGNVPLVADFSSTILSRPIDVVQIRSHLRRRAEEHRPVGHLRGHRARRPHRQGARGNARGVGLQGHGRRRLHAQHAADLRLVLRGPRVQVAQEAGRLEGDGRTQPRQGRKALRIHRRQRFLQEPGGGECAFLDERAVHARQARSRQGFLRGSRQGRPRESRRAPFGGRHARVHLQRHVHRRQSRRS